MDNSIFSLLVEDLVKIILSFILDIDRGTSFEVSFYELNIVVELVGDDRDIAVTVKKMCSPSSDHNSEEKTNWEDGGNAGIRVVREKVVPFGKNIAQSVCD